MWPGAAQARASGLIGEQPARGWHDIVQLPLNLLNGVLTLFGALIVINHKNIYLKILKSTS